MNELFPRAVVPTASPRKIFAVPRSRWWLVSGFAIAWLAVGWFGSAMTAFAQTDEAESGKFVLLRNDRVLRGDVQIAGESVIVRRGGSEIRMPAKEVIGARDSLESLFELREQWFAARTSSRPIQRALSAARWCIDHGLNRQAAQQLMVVYHADPENSEAQHLESRLRNLTRPEEPKQNTSEVQQASFVEADSEIQRSSEILNPSQPVDPLHSEVMNSWLLHAFTARVQPILLAKCAQCHDQSLSDAPGNFALSRPVHSSRPGRQITEANLRAILKLCDPGKSAASPLVVMAKKDHGPKSSPRQHATGMPADSVLMKTLESFVDQLPLRSELKVAEEDPVFEETAKASDPSMVAPASFVDESTSAEDAGDPRDTSSQWSPPGNAKKDGPSRPVRLPRVEQPLSKDLFNRQTELIEMFRGTMHSQAE
ncbi:hypothetical protein [Rhodopirellula bahusiensis]|uniref:Uncharacterized protein n=1 Tax=Rhodopirellula bahusiensis TaxID=2014065 RepID=A0A2G1W9Z1_9BACT|nr:hypothetical protein [Rhodopirellula bahusiensis]PHQ35836.1 hypothetical protein CEE69_08575 [Rhodopirellula bahusiensis]